MNRYKDIFDHFGIAPADQMPAEMAAKFAALGEQATTPTAEQFTPLMEEVLMSNRTTQFVKDACTTVYVMLTANDVGAI